MSQYYLYRITDFNLLESFDSNTEVDIKEYKPSLWSVLTCFNKKNRILNTIGRKYSLLWYFASLGTMKVYYAENENKEIAFYCTVLRKCIKFKFLKKGNYEIGHCYTFEKFRGKNIYPTVLKHIIQKEEGQPVMFIRTDNIPSIKGVSKVGFTATDEIIKTKFTKKYCIKKK